jgi:putative nucleotidyltransferase-like protein
MTPPSFWPSVYRLLANEPWPPASAAVASRFVEKCLWHGILPLLREETGLPSAVARARDAARDRERILAAHASVVHTVLLSVCRLLVDEPLVLIKGADYAHRLYPKPGLRPMGDIDVLVPPARFDPVCRRVQDAGFVAAPATGAAQDPGHHERAFVFVNPRFTMDIHQAFIQPVRHRIDYDGIWRRRVSLQIGSYRMSRLDDVDAVVYHTLSMAIDQLHVRLIRFVDLWLLLRQADGIALAAAERAREWQTARALYGALSQACRLFPEFRTPDVERAMTRALSGPARRLVDRWVLPAPMESTQTTLPRRSLQLWRKVCLIDTPARRVAFAAHHAGVVILQAWRGWRQRARS